MLPIDLILQKCLGSCSGSSCAVIAIAPLGRFHKKPEGFQMRVGERARRHGAGEPRGRWRPRADAGHGVVSAERARRAFAIAEG